MPYPAPPPHRHEWVGGRCACGFRLLRSGMMVMYPSPGRYLSRVRVSAKQRSGYSLQDLCRGCYREMRHADRVAHFVNW